ncbi:type II toxin-antitoxin system VapC family toxin [Sphingomonas sp. AOB5]|uniref:type II toxin-antitoxin system VapC family toxin n=1 Tax=Sphingomonas sp. AOB5 TaxID=3034017 RepID=UPI0023F6ECDE|nr:type II toxin-antitoxin system VapC family toxin [Sphingomonas sp. AOB5]MDF7776365.1 type II toxin-antitoxin system VapC family toxin [Sphingomonas sp. AOB5]
MFLLDTPIVFELRHARAGRSDSGFTLWASGVSAQTLFVSAIALLELGSAVVRAERRDKAAAKALESWIDEQVIPAFGGRILPVDTAVVRRRAQLPYPETRDGLIAATALEHGLTLVTRNTAAFRAGRVKVFNPWGYTPDSADEELDWREAARGGPQWLKNLFVRA